MASRLRRLTYQLEKRSRPQLGCTILLSVAIMDILDPKLLNHSFNAEIVGDTVQFELDAPDDELEGDDRVEVVYALRVIDFAAFVIVTANGVELLREQLAGTVLDRVQGIWKEAQWHMDNRNRQIQAESERVRERVAAAIKDI